MHPAIKSGPVAIYARYSSANQNERSIDDQVRRCREYLALQGTNPYAAKVFADYTTCPVAGVRTTRSPPKCWLRDALQSA